MLSPRVRFIVGTFKTHHWYNLRESLNILLWWENEYFDLSIRFKTQGIFLKLQSISGIEINNLVYGTNLQPSQVAKWSKSSKINC